MPEPDGGPALLDSGPGNRYNRRIKPGSGFPASVQFVSPRKGGLTRRPRRSAPPQSGRKVFHTDSGFSKE